MNKLTKFIGAAAAATLVAASGTAFTATNTVAGSVAGYGTSTVSGATASSVTYTLNADGTQINGATIVFSTDQTGRTVAAGFGTDALTDCTVTTTSASCTGYTASTADSLAFNVAVS